MAGFGLRNLKKKTSQEQVQTTRLYFKRVVVGDNLEAVLCYLELNKKFPGEVKIITKSPYLKSEITQQLNCSLNFIRSEEVAQELIGLNPRLEIIPGEKNVLFYKDTKFQKIGGRVKPFDLKENEKLFTKPFYRFNPMGLFDEQNLELLEESLKEAQLNKIIAKIQVCAPTDMVEPTHYKLITGENEEIDCEYLYYCESPKNFLSLVKNKEDLDDIIHEYVTGLEPLGSFNVYFECDRKIYDFSGTMLIPQSLTHEWGNFILDFEAYDSVTNTQNFKVLSFVGDEDLQEEDLAKKIKLMKRVLERVLPEFSEAKIKQTICFTNELYSTGIKDDYAVKFKGLNLKFVGSHAPVQSDNSSLYASLPRALKSIETACN